MTEVEAVMRLLLMWLGTNVVLATLTFCGVFRNFEYFWQEWEFLAASSACLYNAFFAFFSFAMDAPEGSEPLSEVLPKGGPKAHYLLFRTGLPTVFFGWAGVVLHEHPVGPIPSSSIRWKLAATLCAFAMIWLGDFLTARDLRREKNPLLERSRSLWIAHFRRHTWLIDFPLVVGYAGLFAAFLIYDAKPAAHLNEKLLLEAFIGGASALEMLILTAIHGLSGIAEREVRSSIPDYF